MSTLGVQVPGTLGVQVPGTLGAALLAHQGGWDEVLLIGGPIVAIAGLLVLAKKRVDAAAEAAENQPSSQL